MSMGGDDKDMKASRARQRAFADRSAEGIFDIVGKMLGLSDSFFADYIQPMMDKVGGQVDFAIDNFNELAGMSKEWAMKREQIFDEQGAPGLKAFMDRALGFNEDEYAAETGRRAIGDLSNQARIAEQIQERQMGARGINPNSGVAMAGKQAGNMSLALAKADAMDQARKAATQRGDQFASAAGQMGLQMAGLSAPLLGMSGQMTGASVDALNPLMQATSYGGQFRMAGLQGAGNLLGGIFGSANSADMQLTRDMAEARQQNAAGIGSMIGRGLGVGIGVMSGRPDLAVRSLIG